MYSILPASIPKGQKRAPDLMIDGCKLPCGCWELNSAVSALNHCSISPAPNIIL